MTLVALITLISMGQSAKLPTGGTPVLSPSAELRLSGSADMIQGTTGPGSARFSVLKKGETAYACEVQSAPSSTAVHQGDTLYLTYEARCTAAKNESQSGTWNVRAQRNGAPYDGPYDSSGTAGKPWRRFHGAFRADKDYPSGQLIVTFHVANAVQSLEFRDLRWFNYGPKADPKDFPITKLSYGGEEPDAAWRKQADKMIDKYRKATFEIKTQPGATVRVKMLRHAYPFATVTGVDPNRTDADAKKFFAFMKENYSRVTVPIYWSDWGWESAEAKDRYLRNITWCRANAYRMKAHNIIWPSYKWSPERLKGLSNDALLKEIRTAMDARILALKSQPFEAIDVVNELISENEFETKLGLDFAVEAFKKCKAAWPKAELVYNDYLVQQGEDVNPKYLAYAKKLKQMGAPITLLGYQAHFAEALPSIPWVWKLLDKAKAETGLPVEITEFDLNSQDDDAQGRFTRDLVTAWFAHPQSKGFTMWGFWEGDHWIPSSAMIRKDWKWRPAAKAWHELVTKTWWTDVTVKADRKGIARVRGFMGDYEISTGQRKLKANLVAGTTRVNI